MRSRLHRTLVKSARLLMRATLSDISVEDPLSFYCLHNGPGGCHGTHVFRQQLYRPEPRRCARRHSPRLQQLDRLLCLCGAARARCVQHIAERSGAQDTVSAAFDLVRDVSLSTLSIVFVLTALFIIPMVWCADAPSIRRRCRARASRPGVCLRAAGMQIRKARQSVTRVAALYVEPSVDVTFEVFLTSWKR